MKQIEPLLPFRYLFAVHSRPGDRIGGRTTGADDNPGPHGHPPWVSGLGALTGSAELALFGGYEGILTGALAVYLAFAFLINEMIGKDIFPVGKPFRA